MKFLMIFIKMSVCIFLVKIEKIIYNCSFTTKLPYKYNLKK